jgi:GntR family transcriptional regulator
VLEVAPRPAPLEIARLLQVEEGSQVLARRRRYLADGQPMEVATSYLPWELVQGTKITESDTGPGGIYARLGGVPLMVEKRGRGLPMADPMRRG